MGWPCAEEYEYGVAIANESAEGSRVVEAASHHGNPLRGSPGRRRAAVGANGMSVLERLCKQYLARRT